MDWLESLPDDGFLLPEPFLPPLPKPVKRKHEVNTQLSNPPSSPTTTITTTSAMDATRTPKRQRLNALPTADSSNPLPQPTTPDFNVNQSLSPSNPFLLRRPVAPPRSLTPKEQLMNVGLDDRGIDIRPLDIGSFPKAATELFYKLQIVHYGAHILPASRREDILGGTAGALAPSFENPEPIWANLFKAPGEPDTLPGRVPSLKEVLHICEMARVCQRDGADEIGWNIEVHQPLLASVFREPYSHRTPSGYPFNFISCTSAKLDQGFLPPTTSARMVDFCIYYDICAREDDDNHEDNENDDNYNNRDKQKQHALRALCRAMPTMTVNHTDFQPVQFQPIVISIKTKKPGKETERTELQMAVWLAAQWASLQEAALISIEISRRRKNTSGDTTNVQGTSTTALGEGPSAQDQVDVATLAEAYVHKLPFLLGLTVQGDKWSLVLSTREGGRTILWKEWELGNTQSVMDTYKVIGGLREITAWARDVHAPWWQINILNELMG